MIGSDTRRRTMSNNFREELVNEVRALGQYIAENADRLVDRCDKKTDFTIYFRHEWDGPPTVQITQEHAIVSVTEEKK